MSVFFVLSLAFFSLVAIYAYREYMGLKRIHKRPQPIVEFHKEIPTPRFPSMVSMDMKILSTALLANHKWHCDHDEYEGYVDSEIFELNQQALRAIDRLGLDTPKLEGPWAADSEL